MVWDIFVTQVIPFTHVFSPKSHSFIPRMSTNCQHEKKMINSTLHSIEQLCTYFLFRVQTASLFTFSQMFLRSSILPENIYDANSTFNRPIMLLSLIAITMRMPRGERHDISEHDRHIDAKIRLTFAETIHTSRRSGRIFMYFRMRYFLGAMPTSRREKKPSRITASLCAKIRKCRSIRSRFGWNSNCFGHDATVSSCVYRILVFFQYR